MQATVIIPHCNYQKYLPDALESCKKQTKRVFTCVIDDSSDDFKSTLDIMNSFFGRPILNNDVYQYANAILLKTEKRSGPSEARNYGISKTISFTDFFINLDADDIMLEKKAEVFDNALSLSRDIGVVYADYETFTENNSRYEFKESYSKERLLQECIVHSGAGISKTAIANCLENGYLYDPSMRTCEDYDLWMRVSEKFLIYHIPQILTRVRIQPQNSTATVDKNIWNANYNRVFQKAMYRQNEKHNTM